MRIMVFILAIMIGTSIPLSAAKFSTLFQGLRALDFSAAEAASVNGIIRGKIEEIRNCDLLSERATNAFMKNTGMTTPCPDRACALQAARSQKANCVIYGIVSRDAAKYDARVSKEGAGKYLLVGKEKGRYVMTLYLADAEKGTILAAITETTVFNAVPQAADRIAARLEPFYRALNDVKKKESSITMGSVTAGWYVQAGPSCFIPLGSFSSMARGGAGFLVSGGAENLAATGIRLGIQTGYYYVFPSTKDICSHHVVPLSALFGYLISLPKGFSLIPVLGGGYIFHFLSQDSNILRHFGRYRYSDARYCDPHLFLRLEAAYHINTNWAVFLSSGYFIFFEKSKTGMMATFDVGARYSF